MNNRNLITKIELFHSLATSETSENNKKDVVFDIDAAVSKLRPILRKIKVLCNNCNSIVADNRTEVSRAMVASAEAVIEEKWFGFSTTTTPALVFAFLDATYYLNPLYYEIPVEFATMIVANNKIVPDIQNYIIKEVPRTQIEGDLGEAKNRAYNTYVVMYKKIIKK